MSDNGEIEVEASGYQVLPKDVVAEIGSIKLFNKWVCTPGSSNRLVQFATEPNVKIGIRGG